MNIKLVAIGSRLMGDDSVGIVVAERLKNKLSNINVDVVICETDFEYCLSCINDDDYIIVLDSTFFDIKPGTITKLPLQSLLHSLKTFSSPHRISFIDYLSIYNSKIQGIFIGIEIDVIDFKDKLSQNLYNVLDEICGNVYKMIKEEVLK